MISLVMTVGSVSGVQRAAVLSALHENLANPLVDAIHVLSEADVGWLADAAGAKRLHIHACTSRPLFSDLFTTANALLAAGAEEVAVMDACVSIASEEDARRVVAVLAALADGIAPAVLALSRHAAAGAPQDAARFEPSGLPNYLSADCWAFAEPVDLPSALPFAPGTLYSDRLLARELHAAGCRLFNPCLDIVIRQHGPDEGAARDARIPGPGAVSNVIDRDMSEDAIYLPDFRGIAHVRSAWLHAGYRPPLLDVAGGRLILVVPEGAEWRVRADLARISEVAEDHDLTVQIACEGDPDRIFEAQRDLFLQSRRMVISEVAEGLPALRKALLRGKHPNFNALAFIGDMSRFSPALLGEVDAIIVGIGKTEHARGELPGCTLVTSVFRSDPFLRAFLSNITALEGYDTLVDHVFLVSKLSETEVAVFASLLERKANAVIVWNRHDPGLYNCWNLGIRISRRTYISNANVDDLRDPRQLISLVRDLEQHPEALVAATALNPFYDFPDDGALPSDRPGWYSGQAGAFGFFDLARLSDETPPKLVPHNMPHCMPVWRRSLHDSYGWFDEARFGTFADWAFWLKVLQDGATGWLNGEALSFYYVNPTSHNRRGNELECFHETVEAEFLHAFLARRSGGSRHVGRHLPDVAPKLALTGGDLPFGIHRNSFNRIIHALAPLGTPDGKGCHFIPFLERYFVWGDAPGEAASADPQPISRDWIGILHVPFDAPDWVHASLSPENMMKSPLWQASRPRCRGIITLCRDLENDLRAWDPDLPTLAVLHPTETDARMFDFDAYRAAPRVVQVGDWLRKLHAIHHLRAPGHQRVVLMKQSTASYMEREAKQFGYSQGPGVTALTMVSNDEYDQMLSSSVVLCLLYATAANNVVVECLARATPLLVNPLPAVVEYLGPDYPLYASDEIEADALLGDPERIRAAHLYLLGRRQEIDLTYEGFCRDIAASEFYARL